MRRRYPLGEKAAWPLAVPADIGDDELARLRQRAEDLAARAQYGWGHTIRFGPFEMPGLLGDKYLRIAGVLDEWGWWPPSLAGMNVADVGCFTGGLSLLMASRGASEVLAIDEVPEHLAQCELVAETFGMEGTVRTHQASLYELAELGPERFDLIMFAGVLYHASDMLVGLIELQHLLKPGGTLLLESNAVETFSHSYANFGRYCGGMWWQPTALCIIDLLEHAGFERPDIGFFQPCRALARAVKREGAEPTHRRGLNLDNSNAPRERSSPPRLAVGLDPAPLLDRDASAVTRHLHGAAVRILRMPMQLGYYYRRVTRSAHRSR